jgi:acyl carrier protein
LQPAPVGVVGEWYIAGDGLALGYLNRPDLTASRFLQLVVGAAAAQRMYRTGDLARWLPDGSIEYIGRADTQIKLRGFRVELGEIETLLMGHARVSEAVVVASGEGSEKRLVAYVVSPGVPDAPALHDELRLLLENELPHYMVPAAFVPLDELPLTPNGKVDRRALPQPELQSRHEHVEPAAGTEQRLAAIWCQILKLEQVSARARFFELGGHSLLATRVVSAVLLEFGCVLKIKDLFVYQTVSELAQLIDVLNSRSAENDSQDPTPDDEALEETEW